MSVRDAPAPALRRDDFGVTGDRPIERYTLANGEGMSVSILTYGGVIQSLHAPDARGRSANVTLGFGNLRDYLERSPFFGGTIGRFANRIARGRFALDGRTYRLPLSDPPNSLHGGELGFHNRVWSARELPGAGERVGIALSYLSPDGEEGYPAPLLVEVTYALTARGELRIEYRARNESPDLATVVNLTNHAYWNLHGEGAGSVLDHVVEIPASRYTPIDETSIPTGELAPVAGTPFDFRTPTRLGARIDEDDEQLRRGRGYDHNWVLDRVAGDRSLALAARVRDPESGRTLEILTSEPGLQLYSGNFLDGSLIGTGGRPYGFRDGLALETQHFPDSPNQPHFPSTRLGPGETFESLTVYRLLVD